MAIGHKLLTIDIGGANHGRAMQRAYGLVRRRHHAFAKTKVIRAIKSRDIDGGTTACRHRS